VLAWLAVQAVLPLHQLATQDTGGKPFAWQMFARGGALPRFKVVLADGSEREVDWQRRYLGRLRSEVDFRRHVPPHLCRHERGAVAVTTYAADGSGPEDRRACS